MLGANISVQNVLIEIYLAGEAKLFLLDDIQKGMGKEANKLSRHRNPEDRTLSPPGDVTGQRET